MATPTSNYAVTLKVFNDDDPSDNESLKIIAECETYKEAYLQMCESMYQVINERLHECIVDSGLAPIIYTKSIYGGHIYENGLHFSYMIRKKDKRYW